MALCHISIKVLERQASEVDQRLETQTRQMSKTFLQCDVTFSCKLVRFYYTMSPYTWKNDVGLTGMVIFIQFRTRRELCLFYIYQFCFIMTFAKKAHIFN